MKIELKKQQHDVGLGDLFVTSDGEFRVICEDDGEYFSIDPTTFVVTSYRYGSFEKLLENYDIARVVPQKYLTIVEEGE